MQLEHGEKLVQIRDNHDSGSSVSGSVFFGVVANQWFETTPAGNYQFGRINFVFVLKQADNGRGSLYAQIPIVAD